MLLCQLKMEVILYRCAITAIVGLYSLSTGANSPTKSEQLEEVNVTAYRAGSSTLNFAGSLSSLKGDQIHAELAQHIQQSLNSIAGVYLHRNSGREYLPAIRSPVLTGPGACGSFVIAEDGIAVRPAGFCNINELFESHWQQAEKIEVIKGPSSALYGSNALHGVVNVVTPEPNAHEASSVFVSSSSLNSISTNFDYNSTTTRLLFSSTLDEGYRNSSELGQQKLSLRYQPVQKNYQSGITLTNLNQETAGFIIGENAYTDTNLTKTNATPEAYRDAQSARAWLRISKDSNNRFWQFTPYWRWSETEFLQHFLPGTPVEKNGQLSTGFQFLHKYIQQDNEWLWGVDGEWVDAWLQQSQKLPAQGLEFLQETLPVGDHYDYQVNTLQIAPYGHATFNLNANTLAKLGLRAEWLSYDYNNNLLDGRTRDDGTECEFGGCRYSRPSSERNSFFNLNPSLSLLKKFSQTTSIYLSLARAHRVPQATELYRLQREQTTADLKSETIDSIEVGIKSYQQSFNYQLAIYRQNKKNLIFRNSSFFTVDNGKSSHQGLEAELTLSLSPQLDLNTAITFAQHRYQFSDNDSGISKGNFIDTAPKLLTNVQLNWQINPTTEASLEWAQTDKYFTEPENQNEYPGHNLVNVRGLHQLGKNYRVSVEILNILDKRYAERADFTEFTGERFIPGTPRSFSIGFNWQIP